MAASFAVSAGVGLPAASLAAQDPGVDPVPADTFLDARSRSLFEIARSRWQEVDSSIRSYEALMRSRAAVWLRTPLKDRTLYRGEGVARVRMAEDSTSVVQVIGANEVTPDGPSEGSLAFTDPVFDHRGRLEFGFLSDPDEDDEPESVEEEESAESAEAAGDDPSPDGNERAQERDAREPDDDVNISIEHPIAPGSEAHYRYAVSDSLRLSLPDGRSLQAVGLELIPRERSGRLVSGVIWIEPETGALIRALYRLSTEFDLEAEIEGAGADLRLVPGMFRPFEFDISMVVVEYTLWDFQYWLPGRVRMEGFARAGVLRVPGAVEQSYTILDVEGVDDPGELEDAAQVAERWVADGIYGDFRMIELGRDAEGDSAAAAPGDSVGVGDLTDEAEEEERPRRFILRPVDDADLLASDLIPPPIWDEEPGFASEEELEDFVRNLAELSVPDAGRSRFGASLSPGLLGLSRYNRAEGYSLGASVGWTTATGAGPIGLDVSGWLGLGTWVPDARLDLTWETAFHRLTLGGYHRVEEVDPRARNLSVGNSVTALLWGRDDGDYFRASGGRLRWEPQGVRRGWYHLTLSAEEHRALPNEVDFTVAGLLGGDDEPFRPALAAERATEFAAALGIEPWWGTDPNRTQGGLEVLLQGAGGDFEWFRGRVVGRLAVPVANGVRAGVELGGGRIWGEAPLQRSWFLGGTRTLRGYPGASAVGTSFARGRVELARDFGAARWSIFSDVGWAGDASDFDWDDSLVSTGVGLSLLDGLLRVDLARALSRPTGWRFELYLDAIL